MSYERITGTKERLRKKLVKLGICDPDEAKALVVLLHELIQAVVEDPCYGSDT